MMSRNQAERPSIFIRISPAKLPKWTVNSMALYIRALTASQLVNAAVNNTENRVIRNPNLFGIVRMSKNASRLNRTAPFNNDESPKIFTLLGYLFINAK